MIHLTLKKLHGSGSYGKYFKLNPFFGIKINCGSYKEDMTEEFECTLNAHQLAPKIVVRPHRITDARVFIRDEYNIPWGQLKRGLVLEHIKGVTVNHYVRDHIAKNYWNHEYKIVEKVGEILKKMGINPHDLHGSNMLVNPKGYIRVIDCRGYSIRWGKKTLGPETKINIVQILQPQTSTGPSP